MLNVHVKKKKNLLGERNLWGETEFILEKAWKESVVTYQRMSSSSEIQATNCKLRNWLYGICYRNPLAYQEQGQ